MEANRKLTLKKSKSDGNMNKIKRDASTSQKIETLKIKLESKSIEDFPTFKSKPKKLRCILCGKKHKCQKCKEVKIKWNIP